MLANSTAPYPSRAPDGRSLEDYFRQARAEGFEERLVPPVTTTVTRRSEPVGAAEKFLGLSIRKITKRVRDAGWPSLRIRFSETDVSDAFYMDDAQKQPGEEVPKHSRGDMKTPAHTDRHWWLHASFSEHKVGFAAHWTEGPRTATGKRSFSFESAIATDPIGMPTELFVDYEPSVNDLRQVKDEPSWAHDQRVAEARETALRRDREYNLGQDYLNTRMVFRSFRDFETWLTEAIAMTTPRAKEEA